MGASVVSQQVKWLSIEVLRGDSEAFTENKPEWLRMLIYHELFHCFLGKKHLPEGYEGIMSAVLSKTDLRVFNAWDDMVEEMFSPKYLALIMDAD